LSGLAFVIQNHSHRAGADLGRELVGCLACHSSTFSGVGASDQPGAVHTLAAARELAGKFHASLTATLVKMTILNHFPMIIVCHNKTDRRWFERSNIIQPWWFPARSLDPQTFAADMLFNGATEQRFPRKMGADAWFDFKGCDRFEVEEQSFLLPNDEILTVLKLPDEAIA
jgi:hypothetical protein